MPRYRLHTATFIQDRLYPAGSEVEYDGIPGSALEPLDDEGWARFHAHIKQRAEQKRSPFRFLPFPVKPLEEVETSKSQPIPDGWEKLKGLPLTLLARKLGAPRLIKTEDARKYIEGEIARRATVAASAQEASDGR